MINELVFKIGYLAKRPGIIRHYNDFIKSQKCSLDLLNRQQETFLRDLLKFSYENVPYYTELFNRLNIKLSDIVTMNDLEKLPVLTKKIIKSNQHKFIPNNLEQLKYLNSSTGGSTGEPLKFRLSVGDYERGVALLYRGWGSGGYKLGDRVAVIGGSSLVPDPKKEIVKKSHELFLNFRYLSSFELSEEKLEKYFTAINKWKPFFLRGYASSIYLFSRFIKKNNLKLKFIPKAIFTTSEKLFDNQRYLIEEIFDTKVFNNYGLNDGGISAFECDRHSGMHIDMERSFLEVVDENGCQIVDRLGRILATSLHNYAMPFIRYETGDEGILSGSDCSCGRKTLLLKEISGRTTDFLKFNGIIIGSPVLTVLMGTFDIDQYQIIQNTPTSVIIKIVPGKSYNKKNDEEFIKKSFFSHVGKIDLTFEYVAFIPLVKGGKYKFIINNLRENC